MGGCRAARSCAILSYRSNFETACRRLERELGRQLYPAWRPAAQERVANPHVPRRGQVVEALAHAVRADALLSRIGDERWQQWARKVRMVQQIEKVRPKLHR